jgi:hypothetical protein
MILIKYDLNELEHVRRRRTQTPSEAACGRSKGAVVHHGRQTGANSAPSVSQISSWRYRHAATLLSDLWGTDLAWREKM